MAGTDQGSDVDQSHAPTRFPQLLSSPPAAMSREQSLALLAGGAGLALASPTWWPTLRELATFWLNNPSYQFAWLVVPTLMYLLWERHGPHGPAIHPQPDFTGLPVALAAALCWGAATLMNIEVGRQLACVLIVQGLALSTLGWRAYWTLFPVLGLLFLLVPNGDLLQPALRVVTIRSLDLFAAIAGLPHAVDGYALSVGENNYFVLPECAGLPYFNAAVFLGYSFGLLLYRSIFRIAAMTLFGAFLGVLSNVLRVNAIVLIDWQRGSQMALTDHGQVQWAALFVTFGLLLYVLHRLKAEAGPVAPDSVPPGPAGPLRRLAPVATGIAVLVVSGGVAWLIADERDRSRRLDGTPIPLALRGWDLASPGAGWIADPQTGTGSLSQTYRRDGRQLEVHIVATLTPAAKLPDSRFALGDGRNWREQNAQQQVNCVASDCLTLWHVTWKAPKTADLRHVYCAYSIGGFATTSEFALRAAQGWHRLRRSGSLPRFIAFAVSEPLLPPEELAGTFRMLQSAVEGPRRD